ncbi:hypothetical protein PIB30_038213 [Stylosanthes scabra]|uniref:Uncharacterized protein n=1 Tax=Stylosanthes scabra TaxID=79078 RepID=A0ABU6SE92_9FABA|nr:hypothetical protein [Stylosanthes scabra]
MEFQIHHLLALFSFFLFIIISLLKQRNNTKKTHTIPNIPPSPWKLPIIGNMLNLVGSAPHRKLRDLAQKYGPLIHLQLGEIFFVVVSSAEYAREIMKTHDANFASRPYSLASDVVFYGSTDIAFSPYGEYWRLLRKICTMELLSPKRVQSHWPIKEKEVNNLVKQIASEEGSVFNLSQAVVSMMFSITSMAAFGKKYNEQEEFIKAVREVLKLAGGFYIGDLFPSAKWIQNLSGIRPKLEDLHRRVDRVLEIIINDHRQSRTNKEVEDLVDVLLKFEGSSSDVDLRLTNDNVKAIIFDVFTGGSDTAATTINWAMAEMMKNPKILKKAEAEVREVLDRRTTGAEVDETCIEEMKYLKAVIKETLRLHPPGPLLIPRECGRACEIHGYHIPAKSKIIINAWAIATDPNYWTEPERFYPERFLDSTIDFKGNNFEFIPFGAGRRICPGMHYGVASVELILALLLYHFDWKLPSGIKSEDLDMSELFGASVVKKSDLFLVPMVARSIA